MTSSSQYKPRQEPRKLVENRVSFAGPHAELSIYDTYLPEKNVALESGELLYCGMIQGKKLMHGQQRQDNKYDYALEFLPHESFVLAPSTLVEIDFPEAKLKRPTRCLTVEISGERITQIAKQLEYQQGTPTELTAWHYRRREILHTTHTEGTQQLLERLFQTFTHNDPDRNVAIDFGVSELVTRILMHQGREFLLNNARKDPEESGISASLSLIENNLSQTLNIDALCKVACMSRSRFYANFKRLLGCTPAELQHQLRLRKAAERIKQGDSITKVCFDLGYASLSHFNHRFQKQFGCSPRYYLQNPSA